MWRRMRRLNEAITVDQDAAAIYRKTCDGHREDIARNDLKWA